MSLLNLLLILSTLLCSLVAGFLFAYAIVVMPGIKSFDDKQFIKTFQVTDRIIQDNHPLFLLVWIGSVISLIITAIYGFGKLHGLDLIILILATFGYVVGVQLSTIVIHLPLNNKIQKLDVEAMNAEQLSVERMEFETRWNKSNEIRTVIACLVSFLLIIIVARL
ncbi:MAG: DUF1772 domain-containing protein [Gammaproteobacteria bacterium]|nr:DUF1772 domain-containing protein [Gammaproteobacteria bacterium]NNC68029.1 DUF1772 domain-containing protein [Gammaproteobacteria bacterium]